MILSVNVNDIKSMSHNLFEYVLLANRKLSSCLLCPRTTLVLMKSCCGHAQACVYRGGVGRIVGVKSVC